MERNLIQIEVKPEPNGEITTVDAGFMFEHNATGLLFHLDERYVAEDCFYYLEFITVNGVLRTENLTLDSEHELRCRIPVTVSSQMYALACLNIARMGKDGETEQLIKCKTLRLYFTPLQNTEKMLCEQYDFSVNTLLEAIQEGTFKGEKGERGPMGQGYQLLPTDKQEIADLVNTDRFGLPLYVTESGTKEMHLDCLTEQGDLRRLCVMPNAEKRELTEVKLTFGENLCDVMLTAQGFYALKKGVGNYATYTQPVQPNTAYTFSKLENKNYGRIDMFITSKCGTQFISNRNNPGEEIRDYAFTTMDETSISIFTRNAADSLDLYLDVCAAEWQGLTLTETAKSRTLRQTFAKPLYYLNERYKDSFDFLSGKRLNRTAAAEFTENLIPNLPDRTMTACGQTLYFYDISLPDSVPAKADDVTAAICDLFRVTDMKYDEEGELEKLLLAGQNPEGINFGGGSNKILLYSKKTPQELKSDLAEAKKAGKSMKMVYARETEELEIAAEPVEKQLPDGVRHLYISPLSADAELTYSANISVKTAELESRIAALENKLQGDTK